MRLPWALTLIAAALMGRAGTPTLVAAVLATTSFAFLLAERQRRLDTVTGQLHEVEDRLSDTIIDLQTRNHALTEVSFVSRKWGINSSKIALSSG